VSTTHTAVQMANSSVTDTVLIRDCLQGSEQAWSSLIDRYKALIFSVPIKSGISRDDAVDIFQAVCLDLLSSLPKLKHPEALPHWLVRVTYHRCVRWKSAQDRYLADDPDPVDDPQPVPEELFSASERSQKIRQALTQLEPRCRQLIQALFFETPARPYREVARSLGLALGSIGPVRERCLERARALLEKAGLG
jgi:RNA polymerase sigma factor (sigma-70 family)